MESDTEELFLINTEIGKAEDRGDRDWLAKNMAPELAFRRADNTFDNLGRYLKRVEPIGMDKPERITQVIEPILIFGDRAVVQCIVIIGDKSYHNLRLFVRIDQRWALLAWANEPA